MPSSILHLPTLDNSAASNFRRCERLYDLENRQKLLAARTDFETDELVPATGAGAAFGDLLHEGLRVWYKTFDPIAASQALLDKDYTDPIDDFRTKEKALRLLGQYMAYYKNDPQWEVIFTETPFEVVDVNIGFKWGGKIDLVVRWNDKLWIVDHKTTTVYDKNWWNQFFPDMQTAGYIWAASLLHGEPIYGAIVNMIQVNNNKKEKSPEELFQRKWFAYQDYHIEEWMTQARGIYHDIADRIAMSKLVVNAFRPNWYACVTKYGKCSWYDYCRLMPENRPRFLANETVPNEWNFREV